MIANVLFVCLGNICRSPLAEAAMRRAVQQRGVEIGVDSAGTGDWHVGGPPDPRAREVALRHGIDIGGCRARQVSVEDFHRFTHIVALDSSNLRDLALIRPQGPGARLSLLLDHVPGRAGESVADPYFGEDGGFEAAWAEVTLGTEALLAAILGTDQPSR